MTWIKVVVTKDIAAKVAEEYERSVLAKCTSNKRSEIAYQMAKRARMMAMDEWVRRFKSHPPRYARVARSKVAPDAVTLYWDFAHRAQ